MENTWKYLWYCFLRHFCPWGFYTLNPNPFPSLFFNPGYIFCSQITSSFFFSSGDTAAVLFCCWMKQCFTSYSFLICRFGGSAVTEFPPLAPASVPPTTEHSGLSAGPEQLFLGAMLIRHSSSWSKSQTKPKHIHRKRKNQNPFYFTGGFVHNLNHQQFLMWLAAESHEELFRYNWKKAELE